MLDYARAKAAIDLGDAVDLFASTAGRMSEYRTDEGAAVAFQVCGRCHREPSSGALCDDCQHVAGWEMACPMMKFRGATMAAVEAGQPAEVVEAIDRPRDGALILHGPPGTGKTFTAVALARWRYDENGDSVCIATAAHLLRDLRRHQLEDDDHLERYTAPAVLVLDDLGAEVLTDWAAERMLMVVDDRQVAHRALIVTTNYDPEALLRRVGERIWDRLVDGATLVPVLGESRRRLAS